REGKLLLQWRSKLDTIVAERFTDRPEVMRFKLPALNEDAKYRIWFTTSEDENNSDPLPDTIHVLQDQKHAVAFTKPEHLQQPDRESDLARAADEMLRLEGIARDDFGIRSMTLRMKLDGTVLKDRKYLADKDYRLDNGGYMRTVEYKDDIDLMKLETTFNTPK